MDKARPWQRNKFYKTRLCPYHFKKGSACKEGVHCSYAHAFEELRASVDLTKTKLCNDYAMGACQRKKSACPFAHGAADLREPLIPFYDEDSTSTPPRQRQEDEEELVSREAVNEALELLRLMTLKEQLSYELYDVNEESTADDTAECRAGSSTSS